MQNNQATNTRRGRAQPKTKNFKKTERKSKVAKTQKKIKNVNKNLNRLEHQVRMERVREVNPRIPRTNINPYLATLLDPENVHGVRYPDDLPKATAAIRGLLNYNNYYFPDANIFETAGTYLTILSPTVVYPLLEYRIDTVSVNFDASVQNMQSLYGGVSNPDDSVGLFPLDEDIPTPSTVSDQMYVPAGTKLNMRCEWHWRDQDFSFPPFRGVDDNGDIFYGTPCYLDVGGTTPALISVYVTTAQKVSVATNPFTVYAVASNGAEVAFTGVAPAIGDTCFTYTLSGSAAGFANLTATGAFGLPGLGFRIQNTSGRQNLVTSYSIGIVLKQSGTNFSMQQPRLVGISLPDQVTYCEKVDSYRVVSMSHWLEYDGATLNDGGQSAAILYRGGQSAPEVGLFNYQSVAIAPGGYAGKLKEGTYTIWTPNSEADMLMRSILAHSRWSYPYIINTGVVSTPTQINALRSRIAINYEFVSTAQFLTELKPYPHPEWIRKATMLLRDSPNSMPNGRHLDWIKGILRDASAMASGVGKWAGDNKSWLIPAGSALATLLV